MLTGVDLGTDELEHDSLAPAGHVLESAMLPVAASSSRPCCCGQRRAVVERCEAELVCTPATQHRPWLAHDGIRTPRAWDPGVVDSESVVVQRCWSRRLDLGARAFPVVSRGDAASISRLPRVLFAKTTT
jgi:hypothetical protein